MYKVTFSMTTYTDSFYANDYDACFDILAKLNQAEIIKAEYAYKFLGMYWKLDKCLLNCDAKNIIAYKTFKQLSKEWYCK